MSKITAVSHRFSALSKWSIYFAAALILAALVSLSFWADKRIAEQSRHEIGRELNAILNITERALGHWLLDMENTARIWGSDDETRHQVQTLVSSEKDTEILRSSNAQMALRSHLGPVTAHPGIQGYRVYSLSGLVVSSTDESELGSFVASSEMEAQLALSRNSGGVPQISLPFKEKSNAPPIMLATFPVTDAAENYIAVLTLLIDPESEFTEILQRGRMGESGESYAFNEAGKMISESRFTEDLKSLALVPQQGHSILTVDIRDPGGNLLEGHRSTMRLNKQPLTVMAESAIAGNSSENLDGYNDYRGVPVIGAWVWKQDYQFGITTEIDVAEAYQSLVATQQLFRILFFINGLLIVALTAYFVRSRARITEALEKTAFTEAQSRLLLESVRDGIFGVDADGRITFVNPAALQMLGYDLNELMGRRIHPIIHHSFADGTSYPVEQCPMRAAFAEGQSSFVEKEVLWCKDGSSMDVEYTSVPIQQDAELLGAVVVFRSIRERKNIERSVRDRRTL